MTYQEWRDGLRAAREAAEQQKQASALKATDPTEHGELNTPSYNTEATRSNLNLPTNPTSNTVQDKDGTHGLCTVTKPNGVGEGEYPTAIDGNARDEAFKTPSTPLSKIANGVAQQNAYNQAQADRFDLPKDIKSDASVLQKLAYCGNIILGDERGQRLVYDIMAKEAGRKEAQSILNEVYNDMEKAAGKGSELLRGILSAAEKRYKTPEGKWNKDNLKHDAVGVGAGAAVGGTGITGLLAMAKREAEIQKAMEQRRKDYEAVQQGSEQSVHDSSPFFTDPSDPTESPYGGGETPDGMPDSLPDSSEKLTLDSGAPATTPETLPDGNLTFDGPAPNKGTLDKLKEALSGSTPIAGMNVPNSVLLALAGGGLAGGAYGLHSLMSDGEKSASYNGMNEEMCKAAHVAWLNQFETDLEKRAYMQGAMDADAAAAAAQDPAVAAEMGGDIPADDSQLSDEEVMAVLQSMVESGEIAPEQAEALLQQVASDQAPGYTAEELAQMLAEDVQSGALDPAIAEQIAAEILQGMESGQIPSQAMAGPDPQAAPTEADQAMEVQASVNRSADIVNSLN